MKCYMSIVFHVNEMTGLHNVGLEILRVIEMREQLKNGPRHCEPCAAISQSDYDYLSCPSANGLRFGSYLQLVPIISKTTFLDNNIPLIVLTLQRTQETWFW